VQELSIGGRSYYLVAKEDYLRILEAGTVRSGVPTAPAPSDMGQRLRQRRLDAGLTQQELARRAGVRLETISRLENGHRYPALHTLHALLGVLEETS